MDHLIFGIRNAVEKTGNFCLLLESKLHGEIGGDGLPWDGVIDGIIDGPKPSEIHGGLKFIQTSI